MSLGRPKGRTFELSALRLSSGRGVQVSVDISVTANKTKSPCAHRFLLHCHLATRVCVCEVFETFASLTGSELCEHNRIRTQCKDCGGPGICEHKRRRSRCKECIAADAAADAAVGGHVMADSSISGSFPPPPHYCCMCRALGL